MPIIWRYLLSQYLKVLFFCAIALIAVMLTFRLDDIVHFAALGAGGSLILWFTLHQIPYVLPIVMPISCLISVVILIQTLSRSHELTAFRACGLGIRDILTPILLAAAFLALTNFYIVSELATTSHRVTGLLKSELRSVNPLLLLRNKQLRKMNGFYFETMGPSQMGESAVDVVMSTPNKKKNRINVILAKQLHAAPKAFLGKDVTFISSLTSDETHSFDNVMIENTGETISSPDDLTHMFHKREWKINDDHLRMAHLLTRIQEEKTAFLKAPEQEKQQILRRINRNYSEILRRLSVAMAVFSFTFIGAAFAISISRNRSNRRVFYVITTAALYLMAYFAAKEIDHSVALSTLLYIVPHIIMIGLAILMLKRITKGIE